MRTVLEMVAVRKAAGISQARMAVRLGFTAGYVSELEKGQFNSEYNNQRYETALFELCRAQWDFLNRFVQFRMS
jgi:transcriptional regulator with XRE-family HTH domain